MVNLNQIWRAALPSLRYGYGAWAGFSSQTPVRLAPNSPFLHISDEIQAAVHSKKPVVALETTIYTHGFPYPENTTLASHLESVVRLNGGVPATIGVLNGVARVGLSPEEIIELASSAGKPDTRKVSRRDIGYICGLGFMQRKLNGGTTIAGTMILAHLAGIKVFATGGLGGVHRGAESSMDISADLTELGRTPVAVISSGCKSFLDIPRTLEYLETQGVGVGTFADGREGKVDFPAFWTRESGIPSPTVIEDERSAAAMIAAQESLSLSSGLVFANPVPSQHSIPKTQMDAILAQAILDAEKSGSTGSNNTPFILARIRDLTGGQSVKANRALIDSNVVRGTKVAVELSRMEKDIERGDGFIPDKQDSTTSPQPQTSNPARISQDIGGVGQNIATAIHYVETSVQFCSVIGDDNAGQIAKEKLTAKGLSVSALIRKPSARTAQYVAVNDAYNNLVLAMADMTIMEGYKPEIENVWGLQLARCKPKWLVLDANWDPHSLRQWIKIGKDMGIKTAFEPVSVAKAKRLFASRSDDSSLLGVLPDHAVSLATPNSLELASMHAAAREAELFEREDWWQIVDAMGLPTSGSREKLISITNNNLVDKGIPQQSIQLLPFIPTILTKLGAKGVLMTHMLRPGDDRLSSPAHARYVLSHADPSHPSIGGIYMRLFPPAEKVQAAEVTSVNGAGDTFLGIIIAGLARDRPKALIDLIQIAQKGSVMSLKSKEAVSPKIRELRGHL
ncbi:MAG: hypothetical protein LQ337_000033 [Flavoplaca oasis]|nr:MAG: hypothetical protein LQ337_000033 [Flavoplaca oasis]